jgi:hypothetical protein
MKKIFFSSVVFIILSGIAYYYYNQYLFEKRFHKLLVCDTIEQIDTNASSLKLLSLFETKAFYTKFCQNSTKIAWFNQDLHLQNQSYELLDAIKESYNHGLNSEKYHLKSLELEMEKYSKITQFNSFEEQAKMANRLDILLSDAYLSLFNDSYYGLTDWKKYKKLQYQYAIKEAKKIEEEKRLKLVELNITDQEVEEERVRKFEWEKPNKKYLDATEQLILHLDKNTIYDSLIKLHPDFIEYKRLVELLKNMRNSSTPQRDKINKIILNLERFRWITSEYDKSPKSVSINIPAFRLQVLENGEETLSMKVIVGKPQRPTPILESSFSYAILNPYWTAPETVVRYDMMKKADKMAEYLTSHNMKLFIKEKNGKRAINPEDINWTIYKDAKKIPFVFRAEPGKDNPLGSVKFTFPNKYAVYMHDTNTKQFFKEDVRAFSSGCVRLEEPVRLLSYFLGQNEDVNLTLFNKQNNPEHPVSLKASIPIVFRYMTVGVDKNLNLQIYEDIYGYDDTNIEAIRDNKNIFLGIK